MQGNREVAQEKWFFPGLAAKTGDRSRPMKLADLVKKLLKIAKWSDLLVEGDEPYFGF